MCKNVNVNNFLSTKDNYLKLSTITNNDILFPTMPCCMIKTDKYVNLHRLTFQKLQTELKYDNLYFEENTVFKSKILKNPG